MIMVRAHSYGVSRINNLRDHQVDTPKILNDAGRSSTSRTTLYFDNNRAVLVQQCGSVADAANEDGSSPFLSGQQDQKSARPPG